MAGFKYNNDEKRRLCTETNFKLFALSWLLFYPLSDQVSQLGARIDSMEKLLQPGKENCVDPKSPLNYFSKLSTDGNKILCSE